MMLKRFMLAAIACAAMLAASLPVPQAEAQTQYQFWNTPWQGYAPGRIECGILKGANFNVTTDQAIPISVPTGAFMIDQIVISDPSISLTTAAGGFYTGAGKTGITVVANSQAYSTLTTNTVNTTGNAMLATLSTAGNTTEFAGYQQTSAITTLYFALTTAQGAAATANIRVFCRPQYG